LDWCSRDTNRRSFRIDRPVFFPPFRSHGFVRITPDPDKNFASLVRAFQADARTFSPIETGLESGGSAS
jgi:hypothetical protein